jgi:hypothetical protein
MMTKEEYNAEMKVIETNYEQLKKNLYIKFALSNAIYKKGDIIRDHRWTILIDNITTYKGFELPMPAYHGKELKKDLTPKKNGDRQSIYGNDNIVLVKLGCTEP